MNTLQTEVESEIFARPGAYDGRKNLFMPIELPLGEHGSGEVRSSKFLITVLLILFYSCLVRGTYGSPALAGRVCARSSRPYRVQSPVDSRGFDKS